MSLISIPICSSNPIPLTSSKKDQTTDTESVCFKLLTEAYLLLDYLREYESDESELISKSIKRLEEYRKCTKSYYMPSKIFSEKLYYLKKLAKRDQKRYAPIFLRTLLEERNEIALPQVYPKKHNLIHYAVKHQNLQTLEELHQINPLLLQKSLHTSENTPLWYALLKPNRLEFAKKLIDYGANINYCHNHRSPLLIEVLLKYTVAHFNSLQFILSQTTLNVCVTNSEGRNALHLIAPMVENDNVLDLVIGDIRFVELFNEKDVYGYTPLDYAYFFKNDRMIHWIEGCIVINQSDPRYGKKPTATHQLIIIEKMIQFINISVQEGETVQKDLIASLQNGCCYGYTFLFFYYHSIGKRDLFFEILQILSSWDGEEASLILPFEPTQLGGLYLNLNDLFIQTINDVIWFQNDYIQLGNKRTEDLFGRRTREKRYSIVRNPEKDPIFKKIVDTYEVTVNKEQLAEIIDIFAYHPNLYFDLHGKSHSIGIISLSGGGKQFYDPNQKLPIKDFYDTYEMTQLIETFKYKRLNKLGSDGSMEVNIQVFQGDSSPLPTPGLDEIMPFVNRKSPNGFTPLHLAVMFNSRQLFDQILSQKDVDVNRQDTHGYSALDYTMLMNRLELNSELLKIANVKSYFPFLYFPFEYQRKEMIYELMRHPGSNLVEILDRCVENGLLELAEFSFKIAKSSSRSLDYQSISTRRILDKSLDNVPMMKILLNNYVLPTKKFFEFLKEKFEINPDFVEDILQSMPDVDLPSNYLYGKNLHQMAIEDNHLEMVALLQKLGSKRPIKLGECWL